ncbi:unnamed protein product, partial [Iphiclides podalirius]
MAERGGFYRRPPLAYLSPRRRAGNTPPPLPPGYRHPTATYNDECARRYTQNKVNGRACRPSRRCAGESGAKGERHGDGDERFHEKNDESRLDSDTQPDSRASIVALPETVELGRSGMRGRGARLNTNVY